MLLNVDRAFRFLSYVDVCCSIAFKNHPENEENDDLENYLSKLELKPDCFDPKVKVELSSFMHQSIPAAPIPPPGNCGAFARIVSPGGRTLAYPRATPGLLTHTWFLTRNPNEDNFIGKDQ